MRTFGMVNSLSLTPCPAPLKLALRGWSRHNLLGRFQSWEYSKVDIHIMMGTHGRKEGGVEDLLVVDII